MATDIKTVLAASQARRAELARQYHALCEARDAVYAKARPLEMALAAASARVEQAQAVEAKCAREVEACWGPHWLALKKEIADIARTLGKIPAR